MAITPLVTSDYDNLGVSGAKRQTTLQYNNLVSTLATLMTNVAGTGNVTVVTPTIGTTVTVAVPASVIQINGVATLLSALTAQALGALGTIPASTWGLISFERVAAGTANFVSAAANYTTGYATEAAAIAAMPAITSGHVQVGYFTVLASSSTWIAGTDALAGGTGGNPATTTNYYPGIGLFAQATFTAKQIGNMSGVALTS